MHKNQPQTQQETASKPRKLSGIGRVLIVAYLILAIAATARSTFQIIREFERAPLAITLSAIAGLVYILASIALIKRTGIWRKIAWITLIFELSGVLIVGTLSLTHPEQFGIATVWSHYGRGYLWVPLILPALGMIWLVKNGDRAVDSHKSDTQGAQS